MLSVLMINGDRYLINEASKSVDETCEALCSVYPDDATIEFDKVYPMDLQRSNIKNQWI